MSEKKSKFELNNRVAAIVLGVLVAVALIIFLVVQYGGNDGDDPDGPNSSPTTTTQPTTPGSTGSPSDDPSDDPSDPSEPGGSSTPTPAPEPSEAPDDSNGGRHHDAPYVDGVPYIMTKESMDQWMPIRKKFILGLLGPGNIYENIKGTATPDVENSLKNQPNGAFQDSIPEDLGAEHSQEQIRLTAYEFVEQYILTSGKYLTVGISATEAPDGSTVFLVTEYAITDEDQAHG